MLGAARASQYAGWWNTGLKSVSFTGAGAISNLLAYDPAYSVGFDNSITALSIPDVGYRGSYDLTGLTGFTGYNTNKHVTVAHLYFPSANFPSGLSNNDYGNLLTQNLNYPTTNYQFNLDLAISNGAFRISGWGPTQVSTPTAYTNWTDMWITVVVSISNSTSDFTSWAATGTATRYVRVALFNTFTGALIAKQDSNNSSAYPNLSSLPATLPQYDAGNYYLSISNGAYAGKTFRMGGLWNCWGQMFDPLTTTDTAWRSTGAAKVIAGCTAWTNAQFIRAGKQGASDPDNYYIEALGQDLYGTSSTQLLLLASQASTANWNTLHSTTNIIKDSS